MMKLFSNICFLCAGTLLVFNLVACTRFHESGAVQDAAAVDSYDHSDNIRDDGIFSDGYVRRED